MREHVCDAGTLQPDPDALVVNIWEDDRGFYWYRADDGERFMAGPFQTRESAKWDAGSVLYMEAGKAGIRFNERMF